MANKRGKTIRNDRIAAERLAAELAGDPLTLREATAPPSATDLGLSTRTFAVRADSVDDKTRSVGAVVATENVVTVRDAESWQIIDEVLRMDGAVLPSRVALLNNHFRYSLDDVFGSGREFKIHGGELHARLYFAEGDDAAERAWNKAKQGHLPDVSAGYRVLDKVDIPPGQARTVGGRTYTAGQRMLRVSTRWEIREVSLVPVGADPATKIRETPENFNAKDCPVNKQLREYLESLGLRRDADDATALAFWHGLGGSQRTAADNLATRVETPAPTPAGSQTATPAPVTTATREAPSVTAPAPAPAATATTVEQARAEGAAAEGRRRARIAELGVGVSPEIVTRAIDENLDEARFAPLFLQSLRDARSEPVPAGGVAIHSRNHATDCDVAALQGAMLLRVSCPLDRPAFADSRLRGNPANLPNWLRRELNDPIRQRAMDLAHEYQTMSLVDICREALRLDGQRVTHDRDLTIRSAVSSGSLSAIFTTAVNAQLLGAYAEYPDSTRGWCAEADVADFKNDERAAMGKFGALTLHARGGEAQHLTLSDSKETSKLYRYTGQFVVDEMDIIDDRFGAIEQLSPSEIGNSAAALRPDLVYAILLANAALDADSVALFHSTHANLHTTALSATAIETGLATMGKQRVGGRPANVRGRFLIVPQDLRFSADIYLTSAQRFDGSSTTTAGGVKNPLAEMGITAIADDRIGVAGVTNPLNGTAYAGSATNWYLSCRPGEAGAKGLVVKYRRGTGRVPAIRSFVRTEGKWGIGWDVAHDINADADDYRGLYRGNV